MSSGFDKIINDLLQIFQEVGKNKTAPLDAQAEVRRVEGNIAWVHIAGGVDETPVKLTINARVGDKVQVRLGGGRAWITGNATAPPTDDKVANQAVDISMESLSAAQSAVADADVAKQAADSAQTIADTTKQHFWFWDTIPSGADPDVGTGAHISEVSEEDFNDSTSPLYYSGGNLLVRSNGIAVRDGLTELAVFGSSGVSIGQLLGYAMRMTQNQLEVIENSVIIGEILNDSTEGLTIKDESSQNRVYLGDGIGLVNNRGEGLVINSGDVTATGSIRDTVITATPTITKSSGGTLSDIIYKRSGNVAMLRFTVTDTTSVAAGANVFKGTLANGFRPATHVCGCGYYGAHSIIGVINPSGDIIIRNASSTAVTLSGNGVGIGFTYIIE